MKRGWFRKSVLWMHLVLGLTSALVIIVVGVTGAILAFSEDIGRWANADFYGVKASGPVMSYDALVAKVESEYRHSKIESINFTFGDEFVYLFMNDRGPLVANTIDGRVLDPRAGEAWNSQLVIKATDLHRKLLLGDIGHLIRDLITYEIVLLLFTGVLLWWRAKRFSITWKSSWYRRVWDFHNTVGILIALPILFLACTGLLISWRLPESFAPDSQPKPKGPPQSAPLAAGATPSAAPIDAALAAANAAVPSLATYQINLPDSPIAPITVNKSPAGWSTRNQTTNVYADRYSGTVLRIDHARAFSPAFAAYDAGRRMHGGRSLGRVFSVAMAISALLFAVLAITGLGLGIRKLIRLASSSRADTNSAQI